MRYTDKAYCENGQTPENKIIHTFDFNDLPIIDLWTFQPGDTLTEVFLSVTSGFDVGTLLTIGFPGFVDEVAKSFQSKLQVTEGFKYYPYKEFTIAQTLKLYFNQPSLTGQATIYIFK